MNPVQTQDASAAETARSVLRAQESAQIEKEFRIKVAKAEADFNETLAKNRKIWEEEEQKHLDEIKQRKGEIQELEARRKTALIPVDFIKREAEEYLKESKEFLAGLRKKEEEMNERMGLLEDKLDAVEERETTLEQREQEFTMKRQGLDASLDSFKEQSENLTLQIKDFVVKKQASENDIKERTTALEFREQGINSKEESFVKREQDLKNREIRLADERGTLDRAWRELEGKR